MKRLIIKNLQKEYKNGVKAIDGISLELSNGLYGLLGPNGAGKSSFMRTLATLQLPDSGEILFDNVNILEKPFFLRKQLGYLPQDFGVYPKTSAQTLLEHLAVLKGISSGQERKEQVESLLVQTNLYSFRKQAVSTYSGGMRQRFGIAQALLGNPQLIIVDEPTAGLDPYERNKFHDLLIEIGVERVVILSTHIVEDVYELCPEMGILAGGQIIKQGEPKELINSIKGKIWGKRIPKNEIDDFKKIFPVISTKITGGGITALVYAEQQPGAEFTMFNSGLEEVYFSSLLNQGKGVL